MNILYVTSEAVPFCKTGGLADVAGRLPQSLAANGDRVSVILPLYQSVADAWRDRLHFERYTYVRLAWRSLYCGLFSYERQGVTWYFVDNEQYFKRPELYGYYDDGERFAFFCRAVTELLPLLPEKPDVVHCNDWQTALVHAYFAHGLESVMQMVEGKLHGVLNGIDMERYDPASDTNLTANYSLRRMAGKAKDKAALQRMMGLAERKDTPVVAMVSRLVSHKGLDLVCETLDYFMEKDMQLVVLGKGDGKYESFFSWAQAKYPGRVAVHLGYSESLAMQIYAGADLFLMPSKSEPCGLSQMIAMRYGAVPIVRETGGLKDTVHAYEAWNGAGNGFSFTNYNAGDMCYVIGEAVDLYHQKPEAYKALRKRGMAEDFSWARSAKKYREIYDSICK